MTFRLHAAHDDHEDGPTQQELGKLSSREHGKAKADEQYKLGKAVERLLDGQPDGHRRFFDREKYRKRLGLS
jgi:hypothetical protein